MVNGEGNKNNHPNYPFLKKWGLHTPFMLFVRSFNTLSDDELLTLFGLRDYQKMSPPLPFLGWHVVFANDNEWVHIADDFRYTLWQSPKTAEVVEELSRSYDVFRCSIGDIDESFEFEYYQNGNLIRKFTFEHNVLERTEIVTVDIGQRLTGEPVELNDLKFSAPKMFQPITQALGIERVFDPSKNRFYCKLRET